MNSTNIALLLALMLSGNAALTWGQHDEKNDSHEQAGAHDDGHGDEDGHDDGDDHGDEGDHNDGDDHGGGDGHGDEDEDGLLELSDESLSLAGIKIEKLEARIMPRLVYAPGEVQLDQYRSAEVTPLVDALVSERHVKLGDEVAAGQLLVTLVSVEVVAAQGDLMVASTEWRRVRGLGKATVSAKRYTEAEVAYEQARLKLLAYGLDEKQTKAAASGDRKRPLGEFDLTAPVAGTILLDDFRVGQRIEPGQKLFLIADESRVWVEASLSPRQAKDIVVGVSAQVKMNGHWHEGRVVQKHHLLDEQTRTVPVRIEVNPDGEHHHSGEFVQVAISAGTGDGQPILAVPEPALIKDDEGNWTVFVEVKAGHFKQIQVRRGETSDLLVPITGLEEGVAVVTDGAFFLAAELAKSGFDIHNH